MHYNLRHSTGQNRDGVACTGADQADRNASRRASNPAFAGLLVTNNGGSVSFETLYSPIKPLTPGLGYRYACRELEIDESGDLNRLQFSA